jgi:hypothetical protein
MGKYQWPPYNRTLSEAGRGEHQKIFGEDRFLKKEKSWNELSFWQPIERSGKNS